MFGNKSKKIEYLESYNKTLNERIEALEAEIEDQTDDEYVPTFYVVAPAKGKPFTVVADGVCFTDGIYTFFDEYPCGHTTTVALYPYNSIKSVVEEGAIYVPEPPVKPAKPTKTDKTVTSTKTTADPSI
jgi:hypothetical protein